MRRATAAVLLASLVLLSGCSFLGGSGTPTGSSPTASPTGTPPTTATATPTATPETTPTATATPTPAPSVEYPAGYGENGVRNGTAALLGHVDGITSHRSFIVTVNGTVLADNRTAELRQLQAVDVRRNRALVAVNGSGVQQDVYYGGGERYVRVDPPGENNTEYNVTNATLRPRAFAGSSFVAPLLLNATYGEANVTRNEAGTFYSYRATTVDRAALARVLGGSVNPENVTGFQAGLVVDEEGIVRRLGYRAVVERGDRTLAVDVQLETFGLDQANVSPPSWLDEARAAESDEESTPTPTPTGG